MRWEPLLLIILMAGLSGLLILATGGKRRWLALLVLGYFTGLAAILFTPISFDGTAIYIMPVGIGRVNLTTLDVFNLGFLENIVLTIPLGLLLKWVLPRLSLLGVGFSGLFFGSSVETIQYVLSHHWLINRSSDINDVLANALGILIGGLAVAVVYRLTAKHPQHAHQVTA
ncbi:VanZ family protein [Levilactobacillus suantsaiihabitans]|uniref:VanZ family protein n=1 Tax=Levilactobacillus suantsaiihabitans TaxID=2487722 RepID=A0A4Z0J9V9_9LACO|nr:VanZ family protein [Levilactobacillus suantsaiihabitans]TGD19001.1 VanZ family protein [Levilactobacillus suantsaiihabitans]